MNKLSEERCFCSLHHPLAPLCIPTPLAVVGLLSLPTLTLPWALAECWPELLSYGAWEQALTGEGVVFVEAVVLVSVNNIFSVTVGSAIDKL